MSLPNSIDILGRRFTVVRESLWRREEGGCLGETCLSPEYRIGIEDSLSESEAEVIFLHEVVHALLGVTGVSEVLADDHEEAICTALESLLENYIRREKGDNT